MSEARTHTVWQGLVRIRVLARGGGPALVFFHGPWGLAWDPFLDALARDFTVLAPEHPGTTPEAPDDVHQLDGLWDLVCCYDELLDRLGLERVVLVGHSFGGMVACELAAAQPRRVERLALIAPIGFWRDREPVVNWALLEPAALRARVFRDPDGEAARLLFGPTEPPEAAAAARVRLMWAMGATGKFIWPLPDKGLRRRIHRVRAPALIVWGEDDRVAPPVYAEEFAGRLPGARIERLPGCGHVPQLDQPEQVARLVRDFLK
jgi:pimeloyl-ACP methyl ester carboxylesterase